MKKNTSNRLLLPGIALLLFILFMRWQGSGMMHPSTPSGILALEFANTPEKLNYVLSFWNKAMVRTNIWIDFLFIIVYTWFLVIAITTRASASANNWIRLLGVWLGRLVFLAAILDVVENILMLQSISGQYSTYSLQLTWYCASIKFGIIILIFLYVAISRIMALFNRKSS